jgi:hypothetical protein
MVITVLVRNPNLKFHEKDLHRKQETQVQSLAMKTKFFTWTKISTEQDNLIDNALVTE